MINGNNIMNVWIDDTSVYIRLKNGKVFARHFADFPLLRKATAEQRANFKWGKQGIRWENIDEDLSYDGFINPVKNHNWV